MNTKEQKIKNLMKLYSEDVYKVCLHFTENERKANEVLTEVFIRVYLKIDRLEEERGWNLSSNNKSDLVLSYLIVYANRIARERR